MATITTTNFGFFNYQTGDDDTYAYTAEEFCEVINMIAGTGIVYNRLNCFKPTLSNGVLTIGSGIAIIDGHWCKLTTDSTIDVTGLSGTIYIGFQIDDTNRVINIGTSTSSMDAKNICRIVVTDGSITALYDSRTYIYNGSTNVSCPMIYSATEPSSASAGTLWLKPVSLE